MIVIGGIVGATGCAAARGAQPTGLAQSSIATGQRELTSDEQARHVLDRLAFGARPGEIEQLEKTGVDRWIAAQLRPDRITSNSADDLARELTAPYTSPSDAVRGIAPNGQADADGRRMLRQRYAEAGRPPPTRRCRSPAG